MQFSYTVNGICIYHMNKWIEQWNHVVATSHVSQSEVCSYQLLAEYKTKIK